ncbi:hypothetical protein OTU49_016259, partial [Cherax quadricarinatus]
EKCQGEVGSSAEHGNEENSGDSDVVALPSEDGADTNCLSGSGSVTPDLDLVCSGSPEVMVSSESPSPCSLTHAATMVANNQPSPGKAGESQAQPSNSEEDLFCESQNSKATNVLKTIPRRRCQQINKVNDSQSFTTSTANQETVEVEEKDSSNISKCDKKNKYFSNSCQIVEPRRPLKRSSSVEVVPSPSVKSEKCQSQTYLLSQPCSSLNGSRYSWQRGFGEVDGVQLLSQGTGQKKSLENLAPSSSPPKKAKNLQETTVSNSLEVQAMQHTLEPTVDDDDDDDDDFILPTPSESLSTGTTVKGLGLQSFPTREYQNKLQNHKLLQKEKTIDDENMILERVSQEVRCSTTKNDSKLVDEEKENTSITNMDLSDNEENLSYNFKSDRKRKVNVFFIEENPDIPLKRQRLSKKEKPSKAYFKNKEESTHDCVLRILEMFNAMVKSVGEYQVKNIMYKMKWSSPLTVDKRLKDSLERSKFQTRKQVLDSEASNQNVSPRRSVRNSSKASEAYEADSHLSEDSLPDVCHNDENWIAAREKKERRKRGLSLGLSHKQPKLPERKDEALYSNQDYKKSVVYDSDDMDDLEIFSSHSRQKFTSDQIEIERSSTPKDTNIEYPEVSSSKICDGEVEKIGDTFDNMENIKVSSQMSEDKDLSSPEIKKMANNKRRKVDVSLFPEDITECKPCSGVNRPYKRPLRKTFMLFDDNEQQNIFDAEPSNSAQDVETLGQPDPTLDIQSPSQQLTGQNMSSVSKSIAKSFGQSAVQKDCSGRKVNACNFVSFCQREEDGELKVGPSSNVEICIVEDSTLPGTSGCSNSARCINKVSTRGKALQNQIRPGPLKLKKNCIRNKGESEASGKEVTGSVGSQQIFSNVESSSQGFNDNEQACSTETMEDINKNMMPCPLCQKLFSIEQIEVHASDCSEGPEEPQKLSKEAGRKGKRRQNQRGQVAEDVEIEQATINTKLSDVSKSDKTQTPAGHERCTFCKKVFKEGDDYLIHVQSCKHMEDIRESIGSPVTSRTPGIKSAKPGGDAHNPNLVMGRLRRNIRTESLFDHLEGNLEFINGDITDTAFRSSNVALVQILNCVAVKPHGLSQILAEKYPYCSSYTRRHAIGSKNRAVIEDRPQPGHIEVCHPNSLIGGPIIVNVFGQFYMGWEKNKNAHTKRLIKQLQTYREDPKNGNEVRGHFGKGMKLQFDEHLLSGLLADTSENRICWFRQGLSYLANHVPNEKFREIIFPFRIGCGLAGGNWEKDYLPAIKKFSLQVCQFGIKVKIVCKDEQKSDSEIAVIGTVRRTVKP